MIITLIGSGRFKRVFDEAFTKLSLEGHIVFRPAIFTVLENKVGDLSPFEHGKLDILHTSKMEMSDLVLIIDPSAYIGEDTNREIHNAKIGNIPVLSLYQDFGNNIMNLENIEEKMIKMGFVSYKNTLKDKIRDCTEELISCTKTMKEIQSLINKKNIF